MACSHKDPLGSLFVRINQCLKPQAVFSYHQKKLYVQYIPFLSVHKSQDIIRH